MLLVGHANMRCAPAPVGTHAAACAHACGVRPRRVCQCVLGGPRAEFNPLQRAVLG
jgi:hypothetical protein